MTDSETHQSLSATYKSPTNAPFTHIIKLPTPASTLPADRVPYLSSLKTAVASLQEKINADLTSRMEEDKALEASANGSSASKAKGVVDETKEEDNYGEEVVEE